MMSPNTPCAEAFIGDPRKLSPQPPPSLGKMLPASYPKVFEMVKKLHEKRYESLLSHPEIQRTGKLTKRIKFRFLQAGMHQYDARVGGHVVVWTVDVNGDVWAQDMESGEVFARAARNSRFGKATSAIWKVTF